jgi:CubicO group peptidase (beta-lactamase class C family)
MKTNVVVCSLLLLTRCAADEVVVRQEKSVSEVHRQQRVEREVVARGNWSAGDSAWPGEQWSRVDPTLLGWSYDKLESAKRLFEASSADAVMIVHRGRVVAAWGDISTPLPLRSIRKALLSSLIGSEIESGRLSLTATVADLGIDDRQRLTTEEKKATVHDLLTSSSGIFHPAAYEASEPPPRGSIPRGTFVYNNWDFNVAGALYEKSSRRSIGEAFRAGVGIPIGLEDFKPEHFQYRREDDSLYPAYLFEMSARDLARYGLLFSRKGTWRDRQLVSSAWIDQSTRAYVKTSREGQSFGYLWWVRDDGFLSTGSGGQLLFVDPARDLVVVHLVDSRMLLLRRYVGGLVSDSQRSEILGRILDAAPAQ